MIFKRRGDIRSGSNAGAILDSVKPRIAVRDVTNTFTAACVSVVDLGIVGKAIPNFALPTDVISCSAVMGIEM